MKKVAHLANYDRGITIFLMPQLKALQEQGYEVHAIYPFGDQQELIIQENIIPHHIDISRDISLIKDIKMFLKLIILMRREKFYLVHAHTAKLEFFGQLAAFFTRVPKIVYTNHGVIFRSDMGLLKKFALKVMAWISGRISNLIFSQSREDIDYLISHRIYPSRKLRYLGNGINITSFHPDNFNRTFIEKKKYELGIPLNHLIIGMVGRFVLEKGYKEFIEAGINLLGHHHNISFLCIGNKTGNERDPVNFDELIPNDLSNLFKIFESRDDMPELYAIMDIMVLPSHREGFPRALMEGAASAKPLIASNISGCREVIEDAVNGYLFETKNVKGLIAKLNILIGDKDLRSKMGSKGRAKAENDFDQKRLVERMLEGLNQIGVDV